MTLDHGETDADAGAMRGGRTERGAQTRADVTRDTSVPQRHEADFEAMDSSTSTHRVDAPLTVSLEAALSRTATGGLAYGASEPWEGHAFAMPIERLAGPPFEVIDFEKGKQDLRFGFASVPTNARAIESDTASLFGSMVDECRRAGSPHLLRVWAAVPGINDVVDGLERYRAFCRARGEQLESFLGKGFETSLSASSAVGHSGNVLAVAFLASRWPGIQVENPRQMSAYHYPSVYGPRSPSFARATIAPTGLGSILFVSGTASIVGHETLHIGDVIEQTEETIRNIRVVLERANGLSGLRYAMKYLKVFLRRREDLDRVRARLEAWLGESTPVLFLRADICRSDLLVEIEGVAQPRGD